MEDYFGTYGDMRRALEYIREAKSEIVYGVNCLNIDAMGFELAQEFGAAFVQLDSVVGHVKPRDEEALEAFLDLYRGRYDGCVLGGVRFKYQGCFGPHARRGPRDRAGAVRRRSGDAGCNRAGDLDR